MEQIDRGQYKPFEGGSIMVGYLKQEQAVVIHLHSQKIGQVSKLRLTLSEVHDLQRLLDDVVDKNTCAVMGIKSSPHWGYDESQSI